MTFWWIIFWLALLVPLYTYAGYPLLMMLAAKRKKGPQWTREEALPPCTLVVTAYNEQDIIKAKAENALQLLYPAGKLHLLFITDGSNDATVEILRHFTSIQTEHLTERRGKAAAINRAMQMVTTPLVVFCDANTLLNQNSIRLLAAHFADPSVGGVAGEKRIISLKNKASGKGESTYWKYESVVKKAESGFYSLAGAAGELFAMRTELYTQLPEDTVLDDLILSLQICQRGYRVLYDPQATATETASASITDEHTRRIRIAAGAFQAIGRTWPLLNPFRFGWLTFQYFSHRILRWVFCAPALIALWVSSALLMHDGLFYEVAFGAQTLFYAIALVAHLLPEATGHLRFFILPYYFTFMHVNILRGLVRYIKGGQSALWEKSKRETLNTAV